MEHHQKRLILDALAAVRERNATGHVETDEWNLYDRAVLDCYAEIEKIFMAPEPALDISELEIERAARAICEIQIRERRKWSDPEELEMALPMMVDYCWRDCAEYARAALQSTQIPNGATVATSE